MFKSLPLTTRELKATEARLLQIYEGARLGLKGDSLALYAGMLPIEMRRLQQMDPLVEMAEAKGRSDAEAALSKVMMDAAQAGDAKMALEVLKHKHSWVASQHIQVDVSQQISVVAALEEAKSRVINGVATQVTEAPQLAETDLSGARRAGVDDSTLVAAHSGRS